MYAGVCVLSLGCCSAKYCKALLCGASAVGQMLVLLINTNATNIHISYNIAAYLAIARHCRRFEMLSNKKFVDDDTLTHDRANAIKANLMLGLRDISQHARDAKLSLS